jgi:hypothetical protein
MSEAVRVSPSLRDSLEMASPNSIGQSALLRPFMLPFVPLASFPM